ncbi:MAG: protein-export chaperone SecB [Gammaproteobacteria bacterium]|nr:protein-export chaperone SecB [Gammaproteobacteria bacterium]
MSEENQAPAQQVNLQKIYLKDVSFETPHSPQIFTKDWQPEVNIDLATNGQPIGDNLYECVLTITVTAKSAGDTAFLAEVHQAGIFEISGFPEEQLATILGVFCPTTLFPYARETISELVSKGGFPQLLLAPVNFEAIYAQNQQQQTETH